MTARTISADDLSDRARAAHADIELPGPEGGWAVAVINGHRYKAAVPPVPVEAVGDDGYERYDAVERCVHDWTSRPESDTWVCEWCGEES